MLGRTGRRTGRRLALLAGALAGAVVLAACGGGTSDAGSPAPTASAAPQSLDQLYKAAQDAGQKEVVFYSSLARAWQPVYAAFSATYPDVKINGQVLCCADQFSRLQQEFATGQHAGDVIMTGPQQIPQYLASNWIQVPDPGSTKLVALGNFQDKATMPIGTAFGVLYNKNIITTPPASWADLLKPEFKDKIVMQDVTRVSGTEALFTNLINAGEIDENFVQGLKDNGVRITANLQDYAQLVASGDRPIAIGMPLSFYQGIQSTGPFGFAFPMKGAKNSGQFVAPQGIFVANGAPNDKAAALFVQWLYTPAGQAAIAAVGDYPLSVGSPGPAGFPAIDQFAQTPLPADQAALDKKYTAQWKTVFG